VADLKRNCFSGHRLPGGTPSGYPMAGLARIMGGGLALFAFGMILGSGWSKDASVLCRRHPHRPRLRLEHLWPVTALTTTDAQLNAALPAR
jgi:hypothetical protein